MSIVNFDDQIKSDKRLSDVIFDSINRLYDSGLSGVRKDDELAKIIVLEGKIFANQVSLGKRTEEDVETFENEIPVSDYAFKNQKYLNDALKRVRGQNTDGLMKQESRNIQAKPVDSYYKSLRKVV